MVQRTITIFLTTPSDVAAERLALESLVGEINDVVQFLAPERNVRLELIHYATHTFPDMAGEAQAVVNKQIPEDYDIHFGVMWRRCGTPTKAADSGTVEEFDRALARREKTGRPTIMFYFGTDNIGMPSSEEEIDQLSRVIRFRQRLEGIGLTATYPSSGEFRERARVGLLRAVADILREDLPRPQIDPEDATLAISTELVSLADAYDRVRKEMKPSGKRTQRMSQILSDMKAIAPSVRTVLPQLLGHKSAGHRLGAIAILQVFPEREHLAWLANRLDPEVEKPFIGYQSAIALLQAARSLPSRDCAILRKEVLRARELAARNPQDPPRLDALDYTLNELDVKCEADPT